MRQTCEQRFTLCSVQHEEKTFWSIYLSAGITKRVVELHEEQIMPQMGIRDNYVVLVARAIVTHLTCSSTVRNCVPEHIQHEYSVEGKSVVVCSII